LLLALSSSEIKLYKSNLNSPRTVIMVLIYIPILLVSVAFLWLRGSKKKAKKLPPGPKGLPILGSLLKLGPNPHRDLHKLSQK
jgi:hypothetical protein